MAEKHANIEELVYDDHNFNQHTAEGMELLAKSIRENKFGRSILIDKDNRIIAGNGIVEAATKTGTKKIRVIETDGDELIAVKRKDLSLDSQEGRRLALADNATSAANLKWNEKELKNAEEQWGVSLDDWGVPIPEINDIDAQEDDFDIDNEKIEPRCKRGDIWLLGGHRLMCGDSTSGKDMDRLRGMELADLWLTDPPYNIAYKGGTKERLPIMNDKMGASQFLEFLKQAFANASDALKKGGAFYIWFATREHMNFEEALNNVGLSVKQELIWNKSRFNFGRQDYQWKHEPCFYGWKDGAGHYFVDDRSLSTVYEDAVSVDINKMKKAELVEYVKQIIKPTCATTIINEDKPARNADHPTMKPIKLLGYLIKNSSKAGEIVLENFGGSGSTLIACEQLKRKCLMMELDPHYCDVILSRWEKLTGQKAVKIES